MDACCLRRGRRPRRRWRAPGPGLPRWRRWRGALAVCLRRLPPDELAAGVAYLAGELRQRQIGVGWASLRDLPGPAGRPALTVAEVDRVLGLVGAEAGAGSHGGRRELLATLFAAATAEEQRYLRGLLTGEVRQGALAGVMTE